MVSNAKSASRHSTKTSIGSATGMSHGLTYLYVRLLVDQGLLRVSQDSGPYRHYEITEKGLHFLQIFAEVEDDLRHSDHQ
jgi:predicted transcriptional regulator